MLVPVDDPDEPCYESETIQFLRDVKEYAERGDVTWLTKHGRVYAAMERFARSVSSIRDRFDTLASPVVHRRGN